MCCHQLAVADLVAQSVSDLAAGLQALQQEGVGGVLACAQQLKLPHHVHLQALLQAVQPPAQLSHLEQQ